MKPEIRATASLKIDNTLSLRAHRTPEGWNIQLLRIVPNPDTRSSNKTVARVADSREIGSNDPNALKAFLRQHSLESSEAEFVHRMAQSLITSQKPPIRSSSRNRRGRRQL